MKKPTIAVDLDDVLGNENHAMMHFINKRHDLKQTTEDYNITADYWGYWYAVWGVGEEQGARWYAEFVEAKKSFEVILEPLPGAIRAINELKKSYNLTIITSRRADLVEITEHWLNNHFPSTFTGIHFLELRGGRHKISKARICQEIGASYLIDDTAEQCTMAQQAGMQALLFGDYGWNRAAKLPKGVVRVPDWQAVSDYFEALR